MSKSPPPPPPKPEPKPQAKAAPSLPPPPQMNSGEPVPNGVYEPGSVFRELSTGEETLGVERAKNGGWHWRGHLVPNQKERGEMKMFQTGRPVGMSDAMWAFGCAVLFDVPGLGAAASMGYGQNDPKLYVHSSPESYLAGEFALKAAGGTVSGT